MNRREFVGGWVALVALAGCDQVAEVLGEFVIPDLGDLRLEGALLSFDREGGVFLLLPVEHAVARLSAAGAEVWRFGDAADPEGFNYPVAAAHDGAGNVYIVERGGDRLTALAPDGTVRHLVGESGAEVGQLRAPTSALVHSDGQLYVADAHNHRVHVFDTEGNALRTFGDPGEAEGQLNHPVALAEDPDGALHVVDRANRRVHVYSTAGVLSRSYGEDVLVSPRSVAIDPLGNSYVADAVGGRVQIFDANGAAVRAFEGLRLEGVDAVPLHLAFTPDGVLYVRLYAPVV